MSEATGSNSAVSEDAAAAVCKIVVPSETVEIIISNAFCNVFMLKSLYSYSTISDICDWVK